MARQVGSPFAREPGGTGPERLRVAICQVNPTVGALGANAALAAEALARAEAAGAQVAVLPELAITGYPPEDLVLRPGFVAASRAALEGFASATGDCAAVVGFVDGAGESQRPVPDLAGVETFSAAYNAVAVCAGGRVHGIYRKRHLPNYDVFDELRHFRPGVEAPPLFEIGGAVVGVTVCEDAWVPDGPVVDLAQAGAQVVLNLNGSPFRTGKQQVREQVIGRRAAQAGVPVVCVNLVGGQDELVFDGGSFVVGADGAVEARCVSFKESVDIFDTDLSPRRSMAAARSFPLWFASLTGRPNPDNTAHGLARMGRRSPIRSASGRSVIPVTPTSELTAGRSRRVAPRVEPMSSAAQRWFALVLATRDYVAKSGFTDVCVGLSGGVDSSLTAAVAVDAVGSDRVHGVLMPSRHSSAHSVADAEKLAANLGIDTCIVGIEPAHTALADMLEADIGGGLEPGGLTDQNLQARIRGTTLMALANENGWLVLTTGNKSELAVGYSTLYGDTAGAFAVISDLWKLDVYELCRWRNEQPGDESIPAGLLDDCGLGDWAGGEVIPAAVLSKAPSAELAPGQRDDQSLPPYEVLDPILRRYVEELQDVAEIQAAKIAAPEVVERVCRLVDTAEYKRRQTPIGPRLTGRAFGRDRRMPIINRYRSTSTDSR